MSGRPSRRSSGGGRGQPPQQPQSPNFPLQNPINPTQNPGFTPPPQQVSSSAVFRPQNTTCVYPSNPPFIPHNAYQNPYQIFPPTNFPTQNPGFTPPSQQVSSSAVFRPQNSRDMLESIDRAVGKARYELAAAGENVSAWKVAQSTLLMLKVDSWDSLGFQMQQVPSLNLLMLTEAKINAFIHCFVGVQSITSLYDLEVAICKNERIKQFEKLGLGPLLRHPLVLHYFSVKSDTTKVFKITSEEITSLLSEFVDTSNNKMFSPEEILDFIVKKRSAASKEDLGLRIHSLGNYIFAIKKAKRLEKKSVKGFEEEIDAKCRRSPLFSALKNHLDERFSTISQHVESSSSMHKDFRGKHIRFDSSSLKDEDNESKGEKVQDALPVENGRETNEVSNLHEDELSIDNNYMKNFITTWKEACQELTVTEVLDMMLLCNNTKAQRRKRIKSMFSLYPLIGLLNVAVSSIKCGMWDSMYDTFQTVSQYELTGSPTDNCPEYVSIDVEPITKDEPKIKDPPVVTEHTVEHTQSK